MNPRTIRCGKELDDRIAKTARDRGFRSASAFIRTAIENEIRHRGGASQQAEDRAAAGLERVVTEVRRVETGVQALFALVDTLAKTILTCVPEPTGDAYQQAVARARRATTVFSKALAAPWAASLARHFWG